MRIALILLLASLAPHSQAQTAATAVTESRDAALAYIGTANFVVGRVGRDCLNLTGRSESAQDYAARWQQRNRPYIQASSKYLAQRLQEASQQGGVTQRDAVQAELTRAVQQAANKTLAGWLGQGDKAESCQRALRLIDQGDYDFGPGSAMYAELVSLLDWAQIK